jgi:hypothetical protein
MRDIDTIIVHESDSVHGSASIIRRWHLERKFLDIGYHFTILNGIITADIFLSSLNGQIEVGRPLTIKGAGAKGYNGGSIHVCLIGKGGRYTEKQFKSMFALLKELVKEYKIDIRNVLGHYELNKAKLCPQIDMNKVRQVLRGLDGLS